MRSRRLGPARALPVALLAAPALAVAAAAFLIPYAAALAEGFSGGTWAALRRLADPALASVVRFTLFQAAASTLAALALGLPGAWLVGAGRFRGAGIVRSIAAVPFAMPPILVVLGFVLFFGNAGWANRALMAAFGSSEPPLRLLYRPAAIILAHGFYNFPIVLRLVGDSLAQSRSTYAAAAASLGADGPTAAATVLFPLALPSILAASLLVFLYCFTSFAVVLVLGGGPAATTLPVEIYRYARISLDFTAAGTLAAAETIIAAAVFCLYLWAERKARRFAPPLDQGERTMEIRGSSAGARLFAGLYLAVAAILVLGPLVAVPLESFLYRPSRTGPPLPSLRWWAALGANALPALARSLVLAAVSATAAVVLAVLGATAAAAAGRRSRVSGGLTLLLSAPLASSGIVLALGWLRVYGASASRSFWAVAAVHAVAALPFAYRSVSEGLAALPETALDAAAVFGANPLVRTLTVALPASAARLRSAWAFAAAISLGELNAVLMLGLEGWETLPLLVYRAAASYRFGAACAAGTLLALACAGAFILSEKKR